MTRRLELVVRSLAPGGGKERVDEALRGLAALERSGAVDETSVVVWGNRVPMGADTAGADHAAHVEATVAAFEAWAEATGRSVEQFFRRQVVDSAFDGAPYIALVVPTMVLAEYDDGELVHVSPCSDRKCRAFESVSDRLATLVAEAAPSVDASDAAGVDPDLEPRDEGDHHVALVEPVAED
jgi:hypothetical protein